MDPNCSKKIITYGEIQGQLHHLQDMVTSLERRFSDFPPTTSPKIQMIDASLSLNIKHFKELTQQLITQISAISSEPAVIPTTIKTTEEILRLPDSCEEVLTKNCLKKADSKSRVYRTYTNEEKNHVLELQKMGMSIGEISKELGIPLKNIRRWCNENAKDEDKTEAIDLKMELVLRKWIHTTTEEVTPVSIRKKAVELSTTNRFRATVEWFKDFMLRHNVILKDKKAN